MCNFTRVFLIPTLVMLGPGFSAAAEQAGHQRHEPAAQTTGAAQPHAQHQPDTHAGHQGQHAEHEADKEDPHAAHKAMTAKPARATKSADIELKDLELVNQDGRPMRFVSDVIGDKIVVMDFVYTSCTTVCPVLSSVLKEVQNRVGDRLEQDVRLVSVTVDATRDTPQRMKAYAAKYDARPGWLWLTGPKPRVDSVLDGVGAYAPNFEDHPAMVLIGDGRTGEWSRFFGFPSPDRIMEQVDALQAGRQAAAGG